MVEEWIEKFESTTRRQRLIAASILVMFLVVLGVGLNTILSGFLKGPHKLSQGTSKKSSSVVSQVTSTSGADSQTTIDQAGFNYLLPGGDSAWTLDTQSETYDSDKKVVKYALKLTNADTAVTISEQVMPAELLPRGSAAFMTFVNSNKPAVSMDLGSGSLYFLPALENGVPAAGADTIIYATDNVLLFGKAERVVGQSAWTKLIGEMKPAQ